MIFGGTLLAPENTAPWNRAAMRGSGSAERRRFGRRTGVVRLAGEKYPLGGERFRRTARPLPVSC